MKVVAVLAAASAVVTAQAPAPCTAEQTGVVVAAVKGSKNLSGCTTDSGFDWLTFFTTNALPTEKQATASLASKNCLALVGEANGLKLASCTLWNTDLSVLVTKDPVAWIKAKSSVVPAACTAEQTGVVVAAVKGSKNLNGCTTDSGFDWLTFFTTLALPTEKQATASLASKNCLALVAEANGLKLRSCTLWNTDLSELVTKDPVTWIKTKSAAIPAACTADQAGVVVAAVKGSKNLSGCTTDSGFDWLTFFTTDAIPTEKQATASLASKNCMALVTEANGLKLQSCTLWNNDLAELVTKDPVAWITAKSSAVLKSANATTPATTTVSVTPTATTTGTTTTAPTTTVKSSASGLAAGVVTLVLAALVQQ
ncbi:hypothetical protein DYB32_005681 [Aphanomyces invadans]|uniref:Secreted protein n=1 Tax=Aphanomyces invadans TaxID=157072 RepID=A0A3R6Z316_9STRA|nr:hypothetical protein DYB32_005681 [Aphanomyces invadans]